MTTGICCPTCANGITSSKDQPCRDCEIDQMHGLGKVLAEFWRDHINGISRQETGRIRKGPEREIGQ